MSRPYVQVPASSHRTKPSMLGPVLVTLGFFLVLVSILLRWNPVPSFGALELNALQYANALIGDSEWTSAGVLMLIGLILAVISATICLSMGWVATFVETGSAAPRVILLTFAVIGFAVAVVTLIAYLAIYGAHGMQASLWLYPLAFVPTLSGAIGIVSRRR